MDLPDGAQVDAGLGAVRLHGQPPGFVKAKDGRFAAASCHAGPFLPADLQLSRLFGGERYAFATQGDACGR